jgi:xanthine/CO dehydrogenase XdhC/CoxF family maturation factor
MSSRRIVDTFREWRSRGEPMVLVTVYDTIGSTYSKAGHRILIGASGQNQGLVSGGCLEGDLAERARRVIEDDRALAVTYDLRDEAEELFGLGIGCNGLLRVLLQPLTAAGAYEPFASIADCLLGREPAGLATLVAACAGGEPGAVLLQSGSSQRGFGLTPELAAALSPGCEAVRKGGRATLEHRDDGGVVLYAPVLPVPRLLVLGAGLDAVPLVNLAAEIGWRVTVADHRPAYIARAGLEAAEQRLEVDPDELAAAVDPGAFDAIVVMSHHLATDERYLRSLAIVDAAYIGVLGPRARRERLLQSLGTAAGRLTGRLKGPVGLDIGADGPESIALSIVAEIQDALSTRPDADYPRTS